MGRGVDVGGREQRAIGGQRRDFLGVELLDHAEATEFPLLAVEVAVVIGVASSRNGCR